MRNKILFTAILAVICAWGTKPMLADSSMLQDLLDGGSLTTANTVYSNFQLLDDIGTVSIDPNLISVETLIGTDGLNFIGNGQFDLDAGDESIIFQLSFDASTFGPSWQSTGVDLSEGNAAVSGFGLIDVFNSVADSGGGLLAETNAILDPGFGINTPTDLVVLSSLANDVNFVSSFALFADGTSSTSIDSYQVSLAIPEPGSFAALLLISTYTIVRRKR